MADLLIRNIPSEVATALRVRAKRNGRSVQAEAVVTLRNGLTPSGAAFASLVRAYHERTAATFDVATALAALEDDRLR